MKKIKIGLVGFEIESMNKGVEALFYSTLFLIKKALDEEGKNYQLYLLDGLHPKKNVNINCGNFDVKIIHLAFLNFSSFKGCVKSIFYLNQIIDYKKLDYIFDIGLGDSFSDIYGQARFKLINSSKKLFRLLLKKQILLPQTIGPFTNICIKRMAKKSLESANFVMVRDKQSYDYVVKNTSQSKVVELIDVAFFLPYKRIQFTKNNIKHVGLGISDLLWEGGYTLNNQFNLKIDYRKFVRNLIVYFASQEGVQLHLIPHVVSGSALRECDYRLSYQLKQEYDDYNIILSPFFYDPIVAKSYISGMDFFCGSRMHACIASFSSGVPTFPLAYSRKFNGLFQDTLNYSFMGDMTQQNEEQLMESLDMAFRKIDLLKEIIKGRIQTIVNNKKENLIKEIQEILV